ncbi:uncharacterized protein LOC116099985 [Mastomys coucha]|uniref:uncharacterized protein LOC116099985 n=1 Tax=Mastomys coucha TaxID=35658 RepID=UPI0012613E94|nr:uncharacterized protein LOC116099985 [Mastomys coucha]
MGARDSGSAAGCAGSGSGETRRPRRPFVRRRRHRPRPGARDPGKFRPRLSDAVGGHGSSAAPARGARSRGSAACAPPRPPHAASPPPAARGRARRPAPEGSSPAPDRPPHLPPAPTVPQTPRGQSTATARGRRARTRDSPVPLESGAAKRPGNSFHSANPCRDPHRTDPFATADRSRGNPGGLSATPRTSGNYTMFLSGDGECGSFMAMVSSNVSTFRISSRLSAHSPPPPNP